VTALPDPSGTVWTAVAGGFRRPVDIQHAGDDRLFVVGQRGLIWIIESGQALADPFLDISDRVGTSASEQGLLGLAFHPDYASNGRFYVNYTDASGDTVIARFQVGQDPNRADPDSEVVLMTIDQPFANHNGGGMAFGPDGLLYIATGDGGSAGDPRGNGQRLDTLLGKILRIDVNGGEPYAVPGDNPFAAGGGRAEIWAYGLRNPWRFSFDRLTGDLYIGDVGQGDWEEIDFLPAGSPGGANFGWNLREGLHAYAGDLAPGMIEPVAEYGHAQGGCSVSGGVVVRSPSLADWQGVYLYGDYCSGLIWGLVRDAAGV
jgi:glucose/arabinose dehydrogenase